MSNYLYIYDFIRKEKEKIKKGRESEKICSLSDYSKLLSTKTINRNSIGKVHKYFVNCVILEVDNYEMAKRIYCRSIKEDIERKEEVLQNMREELLRISLIEENTMKEI